MHTLLLHEFNCTEEWAWCNKCRLEAAVLKLVSREGTFAIGFVIETVSDVLDKKSSLLCHNMYLMYCNPVKS